MLLLLLLLLMALALSKTEPDLAPWHRPSVALNAPIENHRKGRSSSWSDTKAKVIFGTISFL